MGTLMMRPARLTSRRRKAFTAIELLVVMAIILVLVALTVAAVMRYLVEGPNILTRTEMSKMEMGMAAFKEQNDVPYLPSQLLLNENMSPSVWKSYPKGSLGHRSYLFLRGAFGQRIFFPGNLVDWNNDGVLPQPGQDQVHILEGQECLVFHLGGIPSAPGTAPAALGFAKDPRNPAGFPPRPGEPPSPRTQPLFEFTNRRLARSSRNQRGQAPNFLVYNHPFAKAQPYLYYAAGKGGNDYTDDCPTYFPGGPYRDTSGRFFKPNGVQIISAGNNGLFGALTVWDPYAGTQDKQAGDNIVNFSGKLLVAPQS
jgi:prepilin-type N-terminal cleavage/methylation domain-containing protein